MKINENLMKIADFIVLCVFILSAIGGTAYLFYFKQILFGVTNILLSAMALPFVVKRCKDLLS